MKLLERQAEIEKAVDNWMAYSAERQHIVGSSHKFHWGLTRAETVEKLRAIKSDGVTQQALDKLFNAVDWGAPTCDECYQAKDRLMHYGQEPDYEVRWQYLCEECLTNGLRQLASHPQR